MSAVTVQGIDESKLSAPARSALAILKSLPAEQVNEFKQTVGLSQPGVIGPTSPQAFVQFCEREGVDLSPAGISAFKASQNLEKSSEIGPTTAAKYYAAYKNRKTNPEKELVAVATSYVGVEERGPNRGKEVEMFQKAVDGKAQGEPWCMGFVQFCIKTVEASTRSQSKIFRSEHCLTVWEKSPKDLRLARPEPGCLIIWRHGNSSKGHVGFVEKVKADGKNFTTVEGNTGGGSGVEREGDGVYRKSRDIDGAGSMKVAGFLRVF
ncbi:CHAP domain-containing protein [Leptolyngbya sp. FACHB-261]|uniref:CHAP domain-containing protein n=1 Tax=Leptolyngbya sp. FACHB-261 TaxID=2692806 RepID=UPI001683518F|nr:CHAP domain-containing protein [Leptolyngbya sp. FACHB-261]MBD2102194.1 CHAP domain-containing protein [Leptolyngbya sp. FACHB-261]